MSDSHSADQQLMQTALDEAAELIRRTYPHIPNSVFAPTQDWFGKYQHLLTPKESQALKEQFRGILEYDHE